MKKLLLQSTLIVITSGSLMALPPPPPPPPPMPVPKAMPMPAAKAPVAPKAVVPAGPPAPATKSVATAAAPTAATKIVATTAKAPTTPLILPDIKIVHAKNNKLPITVSKCEVTYSFSPDPKSPPTKHTLIIHNLPANGARVPTGNITIPVPPEIAKQPTYSLTDVGVSSITVNDTPVVISPAWTPIPNGTKNSGSNAIYVKTKNAKIALDTKSIQRASNNGGDLPPTTTTPATPAVATSSTQTPSTASATTKALTTTMLETKKPKGAKKSKSGKSTKKALATTAA